MCALGPCNISIGIPAYNEEANIGNLLDCLFKQELPVDIKLEEVIVVTSGCTDRTVDIVREFQKKWNVVKLIVEKERRGHASALNLIFENARGNIIIIGCADTLPTPKAILNLIEPLKMASDVGAVVGRAVPINSIKNLWGYIAHLTFTWQYYPDILMVDFEGLSAVRRQLVERVPLNMINTERYVDAVVRRKGFKVVYAPKAITYTRQPDNLRDFLNQRRRNIFGHLQQREMNIDAPHIEPNIVLRLVFKSLKPNLKKLFWTIIMVTLWGISYVLAWHDFKKRVSYIRWEPIKSAKKFCNHYMKELSHEQ
jgi:biofilm PGA synthesis N-glycosyltransferase PgaC